MLYFNYQYSSNGFYFYVVCVLLLYLYCVYVGAGIFLHYCVHSEKHNYMLHIMLLPVSDLLLIQNI